MSKIFEFKSDRLHGLDHLRALAIILVMIFHYGRSIPDWLEPVRKIGWTGVDLFFVLSGYLIGYQLLKEIRDTNGISFKRFYLKRFFRIIPAYIVVLIIYYLIPNVREGSDMPPLWKFLTFTQNIGLDVQNCKSFSHAWSLCIEEQFYILLPITILALFFFKKQRLGAYIIVGLILLGFVIRLYNWYEHVQPFIDVKNRSGMVYGFQEYVYYPSYNRMDGLLIGVAIAAIFSFKPELKSYLTANGNLMLLIGIVLFIIAYNVCDRFISFSTAIYGFPIVSIAYGVIVIAALSPSSVLYKFKSRFSFIIATLSYAIYLTHKQIFHIVTMYAREYGFEIKSIWVILFAITVAIIGGLILHITVEKPFMRLRDKVLNKEKQELSGNKQQLMYSAVEVNIKTNN